MIFGVSGRGLQPSGQSCSILVVESLNGRELPMEPLGVERACNLAKIRFPLTRYEPLLHAN